MRAKAAYEAPSPQLAYALGDDFVGQHETQLPSGVKCGLDDFEACAAHPVFPIAHRKVIRTTNLGERMFQEERRRTEIIPDTSGAGPVLEPMYAAPIRTSESWRGTNVTSFEREQCEAIQEEIGGDHDRRRANPIEKSRAKGEGDSPDRIPSTERIRPDSVRDRRSGLPNPPGARNAVPPDEDGCESPMTTGGKGEAHACSFEVRPASSRAVDASKLPGAGAPEVSSPCEPEAEIEALLARLTVEVEQLRFDRELAEASKRSLHQEIERLQCRIAEQESDRRALRGQVHERDRLLNVIFSSRSWRWAQSVRRLLGRH